MYNITIDEDEIRELAAEARDFLGISEEYSDEEIEQAVCRLLRQRIESAKEEIFLGGGYRSVWSYLQRTPIKNSEAA